MSDRTLVDFARDGAYVTVGAGVLAFQRAQVARRELQERLGLDPDNSVWAAFSEAGQTGLDSVRDALHGIGDIDQVKNLDDRLAELEARFDEMLDQLAERLPSGAQSALESVRRTARENNEQVRSLLGLERVSR